MLSVTSQIAPCKVPGDIEEREGAFILVGVRGNPTILAHPGVQICAQTMHVG